MTRWIIAVSLLANIMMAVALVRLAHHPRHPGASAPTAAAAGDRPRDDELRKESAPQLFIAPSSGDHPGGSRPDDLLAFMRSREYPVEFLAGAINAILNQKYSAMVARVRAKNGGSRWSSQISRLSVEQVEEIRRLRQLQREEFAALMGDDYADWLRHVQTDADASGTLTVEKRAVLDRINSDYQSLLRGTPASGAAAQQLVETEWLADLAKVLSPEELEDYISYNSPRARQLQTRLLGAPINDEQYERIFAAMEQFRDAYRADPGNAKYSHDSFHFRLAESRALEAAAGSEVALHAAMNEAKTFEEVGRIRQAAGATAEQVLANYWDWLKFHAEADGIQARASSRDEVMAHLRPIAEAAYLNMTLGLSSAQRAAFDRTQIGSALLRARGYEPGG